MIKFWQSSFFSSRNKSKSAFCTMSSTLETLNFDNQALKRLPLDTESSNYVRSVAAACFSRVKPAPVDNPKTVAYSQGAMHLLDLEQKELQRKDFAAYFSGNKLLPGSETAAHCYCGHQFGYFSGQLGDGAAMYLGEIINKKNERWEIQLKGAGLTPYSRSADGRKVMRSSIREFLCSEAMHYLGVPTTRAGTCITSDSKVIRDIFYDGRPIKEKCTIVLRIAPTFLRFGSFEIFKTLDPVTRKCGPSVGRTEILITLLEYTIEMFYPEIHQEFENNNQAKYAEFYKQVVLKTARLVAEWQCIGFCHGVLNTDNMSIVGLTIDYGPFGFLDMYNPGHICNASDSDGRYTYEKQPEICRWNLKKLAEAIDRVLPLSISLPLLELYDDEFDLHYMLTMRKKLGLRKELPDDIDLIKMLLDTMENTGADFTNTFRCLSSITIPGLPDYLSSVQLARENLIEQCYPVSARTEALRNGMKSGNLKMLLMLSKINPQFAEKLGSSGMNLDIVLEKLAKADELEKKSQQEISAEDRKLWDVWLQLYTERLSKDADEIEDEERLNSIQTERVHIMNSHNPRFILRNHVAQNAISKAESGDFSEVRHVLKLLENPFSQEKDIENLRKDGTSTSTTDELSVASTSTSHTFVDKLKEVEGLPPQWALKLKVT